MNFAYTLKEGFGGLRRATMASLVAITIITIALGLLSFFVLVTFNISAMIEHIRSRVELEAFLDKSQDTKDAPRLTAALMQVDGVDSVSFISKADAARILKSVMGESDLFDLVESNPLPASFKIRLFPEYRESDKVAAVARAIEAIDGVEEVNYQKELLEILDQKITTYNRISLGVGCLAALASIFLVSNTIKLSIYSKRDLIKTMKLVGATNGFIASPFILEGVLQGLIGSLLASGISYVAVRAADRYLIGGLQAPYAVYGILIGIGVGLGFLGSVMAIRFFLRERLSDM